MLYDANLADATAANFDDQLFRDAWGLDSLVPLVGVDFFPQLQSGGSIGFWEDYFAYSQDLVNPGSGFEVDSFDHALFGIDFANGFPATSSGTSLSWNGQGSFQDGVNWSQSQNVVTSQSASISTTINSTLDIGSPGLLPAGSPRLALLITEIMVQPDSPQPDWEWIEVYNGTVVPIKFDDSEGGIPYVLDDSEGELLPGPNITTGSIAATGTAVLFNGDALTIDDMRNAWDPNATLNTNFIPVTNFSELATSGTLAIWNSYEQYTSESVTGPGRTTENAASVLDYEDDGLNWPNFNGVSSNYLTNLAADPNDGGYGLFWAQSDINDPNAPALRASEATGDVEIHAGGDMGTPGQFSTFLEDADFDDDNDVDGRDFLTWQRGLAAGTTHAQGDANDDGTVDAADLAIWLQQYNSLTLDADFDDDNDVDGNDLLIWQRGRATGTSHAEGDANGDGAVDAADLAVWEAQYSTVGSQTAAIAVPEPLGLALLIVGLFGWPLGFGWRKSR